MGRLAGQSALITGASAGIGRASAIALAREGADIVATGRREAELRGVADECRTLGVKANYLAGDITDEGFIAELGTAGAEVNILVNNAGILNYGPILEFSPADTRAMFETNVLAALRVAQVIGQSMAERRSGHIIVVTSGAAREVPKMAAVYSATKHALAAIAIGLRQELQAFGIRVSEVSPGMVDTNIRAPIKHPAVLVALKARTYSALSTDEVAAAVVFAATAPPNVVTGLIDVRPLGSP
jgi:NADP-dependent 3-hydroxy acid dehydrogenase YdfG